MTNMQTFGPYSPIYKSDDLYFVSGQVGVDPETKQAGKTVEEQTAQVMMNMTAVLASQDLSMDDVVKTTIYLTNMEDFPKVNDIYSGYFDGEAPRPARATVGVQDLPHIAGNTKLVVEIEAIARKQKNDD